MSAFARLLAETPSEATDGQAAEAVVDAVSVEAALAGAAHGWLARFDASGVWAADGTRSPATWLSLNAEVSRERADGDLHPETAAIITGAIDAEIDNWFRSGALTDDPRTRTQLNAAALAEICARYGLASTNAGRPRPLLIAMCNLDDYARRAEARHGEESANPDRHDAKQGDRGHGDDGDCDGHGHEGHDGNGGHGGNGRGGGDQGDGSFRSGDGDGHDHQGHNDGSPSSSRDDSPSGFATHGDRDPGTGTGTGAGAEREATGEPPEDSTGHPGADPVTDSDAEPRTRLFPIAPRSRPGPRLYAGPGDAPPECRFTSGARRRPADGPAPAAAPTGPVARPSIGPVARPTGTGAITRPTRPVRGPRTGRASPSAGPGPATGVGLTTGPGPTTGPVARSTLGW